jgi:hypothetical protein
MSNTTQNKGIRVLWTSRPWYATTLLLLSVVMVLSGPWACIVHCLMLDIEHHGHHHHEQHGTVGFSFVSDCPTVLSSDEQQLREPPSALTIAIVLPLVLAPLLFGSTLQNIIHWMQRTSAAHPPPRDPPRISICFA